MAVGEAMGAAAPAGSEAVPGGSRPGVGSGAEPTAEIRSGAEATAGTRTGTTAGRGSAGSGVRVSPEGLARPGWPVMLGWIAGVVGPVRFGRLL